MPAPLPPRNRTAPGRAGGGPIDHALRLRQLWNAYLLAMLFHVQLGLMPLFHGVSPKIQSQVAPGQLPLLFSAMLAYFLVPLAALLLISWAASDPGHPRRWRAWRRVHFGLSLLYTLTNLPHLLADILVPDARGDQVALMLVLVGIGLLINLEGWRWCTQPRRDTGPAAPAPRRSAAAHPDARPATDSDPGWLPDHR